MSDLAIYLLSWALWSAAGFCVGYIVGRFEKRATDNASRFGVIALVLALLTILQVSLVTHRQNVNIRCDEVQRSAAVARWTTTSDLLDELAATEDPQLTSSLLSQLADTYDDVSIQGDECE